MDDWVESGDELDSDSDSESGKKKKSDGDDDDDGSKKVINFFSVKITYLINLEENPYGNHSLDTFFVLTFGFNSCCFQLLEKEQSKQRLQKAS